MNRVLTVGAAGLLLLLALVIGCSGETDSFRPSVNGGDFVAAKARMDPSSGAKAEGPSDRSAGDSAVDAEQLLDNALAAAKREQKNLLVHVGAPG